MRPLEIEGAIGIEQLKKLNGFIDKRRANAKNFQEVMGSKHNLRIQKEIGKSSWFGFSIMPISKDPECFLQLKNS